jgi:hypothetical protein
MTVEAWAAVVSAMIALAAVGVEHLWVQRRLARLETANEFRAIVEQPLEAFEKAVSDLAVDIEEWGLLRGDRDLPALRKDWIRISRDLNRLVNKLAKRSDFQPNGGWLKVTTDEVDEAISVMNDEHRNLTASTAKQCLDRLGRSLSAALQDARPS